MVSQPRMNATPPSDRRRKLRRRMGCALLAGVLGVGAVAAELLLRAVAPEAYTGKAMYLPDELLNYRLKPNLDVERVQTNSHGLRDPERPLTKPEGARRVLVLGDSFTFGSGPIDASDGFVRRLDAALGEGVQVINAGVPGYSTVQEANWLERDGLAWEPDAIVVAFFVGNDVWENLDPDTLTVGVDRRDFRMHNTPPRSHPLCRTGANRAAMARIVRMGHQAFKHIGHCFEPSVGMAGKARPGAPIINNKFIQQ